MDPYPGHQRCLFRRNELPLLRAGRADIRNVSAGDGSSKAINRIRSGLSQQMATVAEPLGVQGWQLADEMNRAFANAKPSGYVSKPILITRELLQRWANRK
jgi:ribose transport system substrate-binding protein